MKNLKPVMVLFAGPNGSGKTTLYYNYYANSKLKDIEYINPDEYAKNSGSEIAGARLALSRRKELLRNKESFVTESTLSGKSALNLIDSAKKAGFRVTLLYIATSDPETNIFRVKERVKKGGHNVPDKDIIRRYDSSIKNLPEAIRKANVSHVFSTNGDTTRIFSAKNGIVKPRKGKVLPRWLPQNLANKLTARLTTSIRR